MPGYEKEGGGSDLDGVLAKRELAQKQQEEIDKKFDGVQKEIQSLRGLICDENGRCWIPRKNELVALTEKSIREMEQRITDQIKGIEKFATGKSEIPPGYISEDNHKKMWELLTSCKESGCGMDYIRKVMGKDFLTGVYLCTSPECKALREKLQKEHGIEIRVAGKPGEKKEEKRGSFLLQGK